ncbi:purine-binding chemotaxis protein CheW [Sporobacter termitidis DSM 10068]|uniref:Purine-binding chemotaxis protein CheW n=1 Tax=Sporobacter termitidis DSM 10068 TaxID=1123282 RepID=A0A1M5U622_9FIRM|nr:chemotaxis protein CheW [Sporobacter termitidis]SHH58399.1 purine-binding chemotaxis protein CheW [Sporobacter termitidis DSM 10068]
MSEAMTSDFNGQEDTQKDRYLTFMIDREHYAIEIRYVTEIVGIQSITEMPQLPEYVKGIINLRGRIIPVVDVRLRFNKTPGEYTDRTCVIIVDIENDFYGLIVDSVAEVLSMTDVVPNPLERTSSEQAFIKSIGKVGGDVKLVMDCHRMLSREELESVYKEIER